MSITSTLIQLSFKYGDAIRDKGLQIPQDIVRLNNVCYYNNDKNENDKCNNNSDTGLLDLYLPRKRENPLPILVSIHGGGWVHGNKEAYQFYCTHLAQYGFAVINFNYRLAPKNKFPAAIEDVNSLFQWLKKTGTALDLDLDNIFVVGDSAGAQLACQYAAIITNTDYATLFPFEPPAITIKAMALNSGLFDPVDRAKNQTGQPVNRLVNEDMVNRRIRDVMEDYLGKDILHYEKEMDFRSNINEHFPPVFIANSVNDIVAGKKPAFIKSMNEAGVEYMYRAYGHRDKTIGHVFNLNIKREEARAINKEQIEFFRQHLDKHK